MIRTHLCRILPAARRTLVAMVPLRPRFGGWRAVSLLGLAVFCLSRAALYVLPGRTVREVPASIRAITEGSPLTVSGWGVLWLGAAGLLVLGAFSRRVTPALAAYLLMTTAAAAVYMLSWALLFPPNNGEWTSGLMYGGLAVSVFGLIKVDQRQAALLETLASLREGPRA